MRGDIMQEINVYDKYDNILTHLTQWDKNIVIKIEGKGVDNSNRVHFFNCNSKEALVMKATSNNDSLFVPIPNDILMEPHTITGYVWLGKEADEDEINSEDKTLNSSEITENTEHKSVYYFRIPVRKRPKPANYVYEDQKEYMTFEKILAEVKEAATAAEKYEKEALQYAEQSAQHKEESSRYAALSKESADNAGQSEENAGYSSDNANRQAEAARVSADESVEKAAAAAESAIMAESFVHGGTGTRENEETDNGKYYAEQSHNNREISKEYLGKVEDAGNEAIEAIKNALDADSPSFRVDLSTGHLMYEGGRFVFHVNETGELEWRLSV